MDSWRARWGRTPWRRSYHPAPSIRSMITQGLRGLGPCGLRALRVTDVMGLSVHISYPLKVL